MDDSRRADDDMCTNDHDSRDSRGAWQQVVVFRIEAEWLALPAVALDEVVSMRPIHGLPHRRGGAILGVVNVRGALLTCMALTQLLGVPPADGPIQSTARPPRLLVLRSQPLDVALHADEVDGVHAMDISQLKAVPSTLAGAAAQHTLGWGRCGERHVGLLDEAALHTAIQRGFL